jgi:DMSO reductase family type II enzyme chaperone
MAEGAIYSEGFAMQNQVQEIDTSLCRSALYEALALGFRAPTKETIERLVSVDGVDALADAAALLDSSWGSSLASSVRGLAREADLESLSFSYRRLFGHTARGVVPPYETEYGEESVFQPMHEMGDLAAFYRAFGLEVAQNAHERIDHIGFECEFLLFLCRKEAYALEQNDFTMLGATREAARFFLKHHAGRWAPAFGRKLAREDQAGFYGALGLLAAEFISSECRATGVPAGPEFVRLRSTESPEIPMGCGSANECLPTQSEPQR